MYDFHRYVSDVSTELGVSEHYHLRYIIDLFPMKFGKCWSLSSTAPSAKFYRPHAISRIVVCSQPSLYVDVMLCISPPSTEGLHTAVVGAEY